jgi:RNA polymerase sigma-70 factor, ECF subfamily
MAYSVTTIRQQRTPEGLQHEAQPLGYNEKRRSPRACTPVTLPPLPAWPNSHSDVERQTSEFGRLVAMQIPALQRYARVLTRDRERADDLVQTCLARALAKEHLWTPDTDLRAWLFTILRNTRISHLRRLAREDAHNQTVVALMTPAPMRPDSRLELRDVDRAIGRLPDHQRQALLLLTIERMSYGQVAAMLNLPVGTVRSRLGRARAALRVELNRPFLDPLGAAVRIDARKSEKAHSDFRSSRECPTAGKSWGQQGNEPFPRTDDRRDSIVCAKR